MSIKIKDIGTKYILDWNEAEFLSLATYNLTTWNPSTEKYDVSLESIKKVGSPDYVNMFDFSSGSITTISIADTWYLLNADTVSVYSKGFTHSTNRLTKVGDSWGPIKLEGCISVSSGNNNEVDVAFYKNGTIIPCSRQSVVTSSGGKSSAIPFHCMTDMFNEDYIEVWIKNVSGTTDITLENINVILTELV